jgi:Ca-activated chloride channel homolog
MIGISFVYPQFLWLLLLIPLTAALALIGRRAFSTARLWGGLALRSLLLAFIILALAGIQLRLPSRSLTAVFVLDVSDSIPPPEQQRGERLIREAIEAMPPGDRSAVVVFGEESLVERLASEESALSRITSVPVTTRTDIASALQLAMALFPDEGARRLVLLSDGRENLSEALRQAELAAFQQIELQYVALGEPEARTEVLVDSIEAPSNIRQGQEFNLSITIESTAPVGATMRVFSDRDLIYTQELSLTTGTNRYSIPVQNPQTGFHRFRVQVLPDADQRLQNNEASTFTIVHGPPRILLVEGTPGEGENLTAALEAGFLELELSTIAPTGLPATLPELAQYDLIILANVPAADLPKGAMEALPHYVSDLGRGLLMSGGDNAFGAGGYLRTPLETAMPVYMDVKSRELAANLALIMAVDKSGSMGRCHCDNPDLNQTYTPIETGQPKVDIAKEAIMRAASALGDEDYLGVVTFDSTARWSLEVQPLVDQHTLEQAIGTFRAEGQTNMTAGVAEAYKALEGVDAKRKHIILMTDGWVHQGDLTQLVEQMRDEGITLSVIAAGEGSAEYLELLSVLGGGRYYPAVDMMSVPDVFLKETVQSIGQYVIEEPFFPLPASPSPVLRGIDETLLPSLLGYNGTSPKGTARMDLLTPRGDPLLASWQHGLGRSAAWTSDFKGRWASQWVRWSEFSRFTAQLVGWLLPRPQVEGFEASVMITDQGARIQLEAQDGDGRPRNYLNVNARLIHPDLGTSDIPLQQVGPGRYQATTRANDPGTYMVTLTATQDEIPQGQMTLGLVVPYSPEYRASGINIGLLDELARVTGGGPLLEPAQAFLHNLPAADSAREIWRTLLLVAALLFPLDVALRRLIISRRETQLARTWVSERLPWRKTAPQERGAPVLGSLFNARDRARQRTQRGAGDTERKTGQPPIPPRAADDDDEQQRPPASPPQADQPQSGEQADSMARLREAKKRARR